MSKSSAHANTVSESVPVCAWIDTGVMKTCSGYCYRPVTTREEIARTQHTHTVVRIFFFISPTQTIHKVHSSIMFANFFLSLAQVSIYVPVRPSHCVPLQINKQIKERQCCRSVNPGKGVQVYGGYLEII